jgi:hypothetical protein
MKEACSVDDFEEIVDYSKLSGEEVHGKLIWFWFRFLRLNEDFEQYCDARRNTDEVSRKRLEKEFPKIEELFEDWGDIHILPAMYSDDLLEWKDWLASKRWLFFTSPMKLIDPPIAGLEKGSRLLSIPSGLDKKQLKKLFEKFIDSTPGIIGNGPKYVPMKMKGWSQAGILERLDKAEFVNDLVSGEDEFKYSHAEIALLIVKIPFLRTMGLNWQVHGKDKKARLANGTLSQDDVENYKRTILNFNKFYTNTVENTIHGVFPALL